MIVANLATYPKRAKFLDGILAMIAPQVDRLNVVLNEYTSVPDCVAKHDNVVAIIPDHDTKDVGKFYPDTSGATYVFFIDDDLIYPVDYVSKTINRAKDTQLERFFGGYHCSIYERPKFGLKVQDLKDVLRFAVSPTHIARFRKMLHFGSAVEHPIYVDQIGTGAAVMTGADVPPYDYMKSSQKFVDVRMARWCFEQNIPRLYLPQTPKWLDFETVEDSIYQNFTRHNPKHVAEEIYSFAFRDPRAGRPLAA